MGLKDGAGLEQWEIAVTKKIVSDFRRRFRSLAREDFDDLQQECLLHWIQVRARLVPVGEGPPVAYMSQVLRNMLTDYVREKAADKRGGEQEILSLDAPVDGSDDGFTLGDLIADTTVAVSGDAVGSTRHHTELDVARALEQLTPMQRRICTMLGEEGLSVKETAKRLRIPRGTLYEEIKRIRQSLADQGLADYLKE
ncbi:MAG: sigma-70 family RNA polymerase sigma factor [Gammaproteobacteria bacterium]|nr:sigma-70 family RNA polymerase sigma factor [Gammaproteobacteria bacterium]